MGTVELQRRRAAMLLREGEYWTIAVGERSIRVRDSKGMGYLAELLARPAREIEAVSLVCAGVAEVSGPEALQAGLTVCDDADAGPVLDGPAKRAYRQRLADLQSEIDRAQSWHDEQRALSARLEWEAIVDQLRTATGLGRRDRRAGSRAERARLNVTRAIKSAIARIAAHDEALGEHLSRCVRTGRVCVYRPELGSPIRWDVSSRAVAHRQDDDSCWHGTGPGTSLRIAYRGPGEWATATPTRTSLTAAAG